MLVVAGWVLKCPFLPTSGIWHTHIHKCLADFASVRTLLRKADATKQARGNCSRTEFVLHKEETHKNAVSQKQSGAPEARALR